MNTPSNSRREPFIGEPDAPVTPDHGLGDILGQNAARGTNPRPAPPPGVNPYAGHPIPGGAPRAASPPQPAGAGGTGGANPNGENRSDANGGGSGVGLGAGAQASAGGVGAGRQSGDPGAPPAQGSGSGSRPDALAPDDFDADSLIYADEGATISRLATELAQLKGELAEARERQVRAMAETENVRRRASEDVAKAYKFSVESFAEAMLPVVDSLEMGLKVENPTVETLREGTEATLRQLNSAFEKNKLVVIDPAGAKFDPNQHQAISMVPASAVNPPVPANHVAAVLQKGYLINDRVLRPALVTVVQG